MDVVAFPWRHWRLLLLRDASDVDAVLHAVRDCFRGGACPVPARDALELLWRVWCRPAYHERDESLAGVLLVVAAATGSESALALKLLRLSYEDAARDLQAFAHVADQWGPRDSALRDELTELWTQLLRVATSLLASSTCGSENDLQSEDAMAWDEFAALSSSLDACALHKSKDGRAVVQELDEVVALQARRLMCAETAPTSEVLAVRDMLKDIVGQLETRLTPSHPQLGPIKGASRTVETTGYSECADEASVRRYVHRSGADQAEPTAMSDELKRDPLLSAPPVSTLDGLASFDMDERQCEACATGVLDELSSIDDVVPLCVRVAALLGWQLQTRVAIASRVSTATRHEWGRVIRKEVNSLTSGGDDASQQLRQLLRYAAIDPGMLIDALMSSVTTTMHHHSFLVRLLRWCPLLVRWRENSASPRLATSLRSEIADLVANGPAAAAPVEDSAVFQFTLKLSAGEAILSIDSVLDGIFWAALDTLAVADGPKPVTRLFEMVHRFVQETGEFQRQCSADQRLKSFRLVCEQYKRHCGPESSGDDDADFRDIALLLTREVVTPTADDPFDGWTPDGAMQALLQLHGVRPSKPAQVEDGNSSSTNPLPVTHAVTASIQDCLWSLVWAAEATAEHAVFSRQLAHTMTCAFVDSSGGSSTIDGASLVQIELTKMLLISGRRSFEWILKMVEIVVLPILLIQSPPREGSEPLPSSTESERDAGAVRPVTPTEIMAYTVRCWCIGAFAASDIKTETLLRMLNHTLRPIEQAIESAAQDPSTLLQCIQVVGLVYAWLRAKSEFRQALSLSHRVEMASVRLLFLLAQLPSDTLPPQEQSLFRASVANVLSSCQLLESDTLSRFLQAQHGPERRR